MTSPTQLLAKSCRDPEAPAYHETYVGHIMGAAGIAHRLVKERGKTFLGAMGLGPEWLAKLEEATIRGAYIHDIGKANEQFQRLVLGAAKSQQAFRHEIISLLLVLKWKPLAGLMDSSKGDEVVYASLFSASGHHLKLETFDLAPRAGSGQSWLKLYTGHPDMKSLLEQGRSVLDLPVSSSDLKDLKIDLAGDPMKEVETWLRHAAMWWDQTHEETRRFVAIVKALVLAADLVASASVRDAGVQTWVNSALEKVCLRNELLGVVANALNGRRPRAFQKRVKDSRSRVTFVHAGCGTGKTVAAYLWAAKTAVGRKVFFCYPTTGTATQGYLDYATEGGVDSRLVHSRSEVDLEISEVKGDETNPLDPAIRYEAFAAWGAPLVVATADTVLGLIQNNRRGLFSFPAICEGAFVFDEIHTYDERLFGALLRFLDAFSGAKFLLMTASLQPERLERIQELLGKRGETLGVIRGPKKFEDAKRYQLIGVRKEEPWDEVVHTLRKMGKVLWVVNTVERAKMFWNQAKEKIPEVVPLIYHSRYRYIDRINHHASVMKAFEEKGPVFAVTTQVCEVSLDISADMLVTDLAPAPALIQRMGRVNRRGIPSKPRPVYVVEPEGSEPYTEEELQTARRWVFKLTDEIGNQLSQADLAAKFESHHSENSGISEVTSSWIDGGPRSVPAPLRDEGYTFLVIRHEDRSRCFSSNGKPLNRKVIRYAIPMPYAQVSREALEWERLNSAFVAPAGRLVYSKDEGGSW